jgi:hypothetical protein
VAVAGQVNCTVIAMQMRNNAAGHRQTTWPQQQPGMLLLCRCKEQPLVPSVAACTSACALKKSLRTTSHRINAVVV